MDLISLVYVVDLLADNAAPQVLLYFQLQLRSGAYWMRSLFFFRGYLLMSQANLVRDIDSYSFV